MTASWFNDRIQIIDNLIANADEGTFNIEVLQTLKLEELQDLYMSVVAE
jgi:hypothetical protein